MTLRNEYLRLYREASGKDIDLPKLEECNRKLDSSLRRLIKVSEVSNPQEIDVFIGAFPLLIINAQVRRSDSGILILVYDGIIPFAFETGVLLGGLLPLKLHGIELEPEVKLSDAQRIFGEMLITFLKTRGIKRGNILLHNNSRQEFACLVYNSIMWFVVAHELAHILCGHLKDEKTEKLMIGTSSVEFFVNSWQDEMEADQTAIRLLRKLHVDNVCADTIYLGPIVFFELAESIMYFASKLDICIMTSISTHPPSKARRSAIVQDTYSPGDVPQTFFLDHVVYIMEKLRIRL